MGGAYGALARPGQPIPPRTPEILSFREKQKSATLRSDPHTTQTCTTHGGSRHMQVLWQGMPQSSANGTRVSPRFGIKRAVQHGSEPQLISQHLLCAARRWRRWQQRVLVNQQEMARARYTMVKSGGGSTGWQSADGKLDVGAHPTRSTI